MTRLVLALGIFGLAATVSCASTSSEAIVPPSPSVRSTQGSLSLDRVASIGARFGERGRRALGVEHRDTGSRSVHVRVPEVASGAFEVRDPESNVWARVRLRGVESASVENAGRVSLYREALAGADMLVRPDAVGVEDFVFFASRPDREELVYDVELSEGAHTRGIVGRTLEVVDRSGVTRLRVMPPWVLDGDGERLEATLVLEGCQDNKCVLRIGWHARAYPVLVDPSWLSGNGAFREKGGATLSVLADGRVLSIGGFANELYDPKTNGWTFVDGCDGASGIDADTHTATTLPSGKILVTGGGRFGVPNRAESFLNGSAVCDATGAMNAARGNHTATLLPNGKVLVAGGRTAPNAAAMNSAELYDPATGKFVLTGAMSEARSSHSAVLLGNGKVLVTAGNANTAAELYDPATGKFVPTGSMMVARRGRPTATLLGNGKVLVAGGRNVADGLLSAAELYDPATGTFTATGSMITARDAHVAVRLPNGKVLVLGGDTNAAELYDPRSGAFTATVPSIGIYPWATTALLGDGRVLVIPEYGFSEVYDPTKPLAAKCTTAAECDSGFCTDGVCCSAACSGQCEACDVENKVGTCTPVTGTPHGPRKPCAGGGSVCGGSCRGVNPNACSFADPTTVCSESCRDNSKTTSTCNGLGDCVAGAATSCNNLVCADERTCKASCGSNADCIPGFLCQSGKCINGTTCVDEDTAQPLEGPPQECAPYRCLLGCKTKCVSVNDCVAGFVCDAAGRCVSASPPATEEGCAVGSGAGGSLRSVLASVLAFLGLAAWHRRRRARRSVR